ncbi:MAG TPA: hypothetical protein VG965_00825 [Patescibacteria group bacterium]|nr:hypothetical protein [Patescibacteria group bacterium]
MSEQDSKLPESAIPVDEAGWDRALPLGARIQTVRTLSRTYPNAEAFFNLRSALVAAEEKRREEVSQGRGIPFTEGDVYYPEVDFPAFVAKTLEYWWNSTKEQPQSARAEQLGLALDRFGVDNPAGIGLSTEELAAEKGITAEKMEIDLMFALRLFTYNAEFRRSGKPRSSKKPRKE